MEDYYISVVRDGKGYCASYFDLVDETGYIPVLCEVTRKFKIMAQIDAVIWRIKERLT